MLGGLATDGVTATSDAVLGAVREFAGDTRQSDDITMLTLRYLKRQDV